MAFIRIIYQGYCYLPSSSMAEEVRAVRELMANFGFDVQRLGLSWAVEAIQQVDMEDPDPARDEVQGGEVEEMFDEDSQLDDSSHETVPGQASNHSSSFLFIEREAGPQEAVSQEVDPQEAGPQEAGPQEANTQEAVLDEASGLRRSSRRKTQLCPECGKEVRDLSAHRKVDHPDLNKEKDQPGKKQRKVKPKQIQKKPHRIASVCPDCGKVFNQKYTMMEHRRSKHEGVKYPCDQCTYQATTRGSLKKHLQSVHEGIKYACPHCDYQATEKSSLKKHIQSQHEDTQYACSQCDYRGASQSNLQRHIQSTHKVEKEANKNKKKNKKGS